MSNQDPNLTDKNDMETQMAIASIIDIEHNYTNPNDNTDWKRKRDQTEIHLDLQDTNNTQTNRTPS